MTIPDWLANVMPTSLVAMITGGAGYGVAQVNAKSSRSTERMKAKSTVESAALTAQNLLIDQLQEELKRFRERTDARLAKLEAENTAYRRALLEHRDYMLDHNLQPPTWPIDIPR
jgi:hypothetical protein